MTMSDDRPEIPDALQQDAQAWVRKLHSGAATQWEAQTFRRWRDASPLHQAAFLEARAQWRLLQPALQKLATTNVEAANYHRQTLRGPRLSRRTFLGAVTSTAAVAGVAGMAVYSPLGFWPAVGDWNADYRTATGEQRTVTLPNQVSVTLNTRTSMRRVAQDPGEVGLDLVSGEAAFEISPASRAFSVVAGAGRSISAESARFEVRHLEGRVCVTCLDGRVRIEHPAGHRLLQAQQQAIYSEQSISSISGIDPEAVSAWRRGELVFKQTPLAAVVEEINRYRPGRVMLIAEAVSDKTLSARFMVERLDLALLQIQHSFDLTARSFPAGMLVLS